jgi:hypothetical protein
VLREIADGDNGRPLSSVEAQKRAEAVLDECGYTWPLPPVAAPAAKPHSDAARRPIGTAITRGCDVTTERSGGRG